MSIVPTKTLGLTAEPEKRHRHTALALREYITREGISISEFGRRIGADGKGTVPYPWLRGTGAIGPRYVPVVAKLLGVHANDLAPLVDDNRPLTGRKAVGPARAAREALQGVVVTAPSTTLAAGPVVSGSGKLSYQGHGDGTATITVHARMTVEQAKPLFRMLLDSGIDLEGATAS